MTDSATREEERKRLDDMMRAYAPPSHWQHTPLWCVFPHAATLDHSHNDPGAATLATQFSHLTIPNKPAVVVWQPALAPMWVDMCTASGVRTRWPQQLLQCLQQAVPSMVLFIHTHRRGHCHALPSEAPFIVLHPSANKPPTYVQTFVQRLRTLCGNKDNVMAARGAQEDALLQATLKIPIRAIWISVRISSKYQQDWMNETTRMLYKALESVMQE